MSLRWIAFGVAVWASLAPAAHLLEMPNKLALDGPPWLAVQQSLYRGWGPLIGGPSEIAALVLNCWLITKPPAAARPFHIAAALAYAAMLAIFFIFNAPVNAALNGWTAATLPADWSSYRLRWESGHAMTALLALAALYATLRAALRDTPRA